VVSAAALPPRGRPSDEGPSGFFAALPPPGRPGDEEFSEFFRAWRLVLVRYLIVIGCPASEADDIAQDSFLAVRGRWDHVRGLERPPAYLFKVAARRLWRTRKLRHPELLAARDPGEYHAAFPDPADALSAAEDQADAMAMVRQLPLRQRQVFWLRIVADFSEAETAQVLSVSTGTVKSQLHAARKKLSELARKARGDDTR
jgi:RNA polymerase sigma factor (sigma-70 family)